MRPVRIPGPLVAAIRSHGRETYPDECCGFLLAGPDPPDPAAPREIVAVERAPNEFEGERRRRFVIRAEDLRAAERALDGTDRIIAGFYHSHPDHPARPSSFDQEQAWPWYTYVIVAVSRDGASAVGAFELEPESGTFQPVPWSEDPDEAEVTATLSAPEAR